MSQVLQSEYMPLAGAEKPMERSLGRVAILALAVLIGFFLAYLDRARYLAPFTDWRRADKAESTDSLTFVHTDGARKSS
jgi:hypothetical protein